MSNNNCLTLHFTLGPVQGFVAQARRTRDLWGGSFLLSWLSGQAMKSVIDNGGKIVFPVVDDGCGRFTDPLLASILGLQVEGSPASIGTIPNRFKASIPPEFDPQNCKQAVLSAWKTIADKVYERFVLPIESHGEGTKKIWRRQVENFWEIAWVAGVPTSEDNDNAWLDARKNWRDHLPPEEAGDHCTIMGDFQELSGHIRSQGRVQRENQDRFWDKLREVKDIGYLDIREGERLCAIALIKRLFPLLGKEVVGWQVDTRNWPSTAYLAAVPWIRAAWDADLAAAEAYAAQVKLSCSDSAYGERATEIDCLNHIPVSFRGLDGRTLYPHIVENAQQLPLKNEGDRDKLKAALNRLMETVKAKSGKEISPFYALLLMDGDSLGALLRSFDEPQEVSRALATFTERVPGIVRAHNGVTVYAGGDDVLALLPLPNAIGAAEELRLAYRAAFSQNPAATISGAIIFANQKLPLQGVLREGHHQLDDIAKNANGRDSIAISVLKGGTRNCQWVSTWDGKNQSRPAIELERLANEYSEQIEFSSRLLYALRDRFNMLIDEDGHLMTGLDPVQLLAAEFIRNAHRSYTPLEAENQARKLLQICTVIHNHSENGDRVKLQPEGALLVRFLAQRGVEK